MNRNVLKIIALITMIIDHIGLYLFPNIIWFRVVGRLAFPIFAYFIAEGMRYTRNRGKYALLLSIFAVVSQIPFALLGVWYKLNILFTFLISILLIYLIETFKNQSIIKTIVITIIFMLLILTDIFNIVDYGIFGVLLVLIFYFIKDKALSLIVGTVCLIVLTVKQALYGGFVVSSFVQITSVISILLLCVYNGQKGRVNLKYLFYITFPIHLIIIYIIGFFV